MRFVNAAVETQTDSKGHLALLVPTPEPENPGGVGTDTLIYEKPGYKTLILRNFGVASDEMGPSAVDMERGTGALDRDATHKLMGRTPTMSRIHSRQFRDRVYRPRPTHGSEPKEVHFQ